jgi:hypothetical protein
MLISAGLLLVLLCGSSSSLVAATCPSVRVGTPTELTLSSSDPDSLCFVAPGEASQQYRLTIRTPTYGRYQIQRGSSGFGWSRPADGIYYCTPGAFVITFGEYVAGATVTINARLKPSDCVSDFIGFNGKVPIKATDAGDTTAVYWSHHMYYLKASEFKFEIPGEGTVTMRNGSSVEISGDPGSETYISIEVYWTLGGKRKRFNGYLTANGTNWWMDEARVYNADEEWVYFGRYQASPGGTVVLQNTPLMSGKLNECFQRDELVLSSTDSSGSSITFKNFALAAFLPWHGRCAPRCSAALLRAADSGVDSGAAPQGLGKRLPCVHQRHCAGHRR